MWKYRVFKIAVEPDPENPEGKHLYEIREVLYDKDDQPVTYADEPCSPFGFHPDDVQNNIILMLSDVNESLLMGHIFSKEDFAPGGRFYENYLQHEQKMLDTFKTHKDKAEKFFDMIIDLQSPGGNVTIKPKKYTDNVVKLFPHGVDVKKDDDESND